MGDHGWITLPAPGWIRLGAPGGSPTAPRDRGYTKKNGTHVAPHMRSAPDGNKRNNWSTKGNVNPYTGKAGKKNP